MVAAIGQRRQIWAAAGPAALARWVAPLILAPVRRAPAADWPAAGGHWFSTGASAGDQPPALGAQAPALDETPQGATAAAPAPTAPPSDPSAPSAPPPPSPDDAPLLQAARRGDLPAFNALVLRYERGVFNVCLRLLRDAGSAEDVTQETFVKAWTSLATFKGEHLRPWLFRIATNRCYDLLRVRSRRPAASLDAEPFEREPVWSSHAAAEEAPEAHTLRQELSIYMERALAALPADQRAAVLLADVHGCDYGEIALATDAALGTVKSRISRARARLRQLLQDDPEAGELFDRYSRHFDDQGEASRR